MTTFTTEDRIEFEKEPEPTQEELWNKKWQSWIYSLRNGAEYYLQGKIEYFFPLTEQIGLDLDYTESDPPKLSYSYTILDGTGFTLAPGWGTTTISNIAPQLTVQPINSVGQLNIGGISVGLEKEPKWYQKVLFKVLGFNWKDLK